MEIIWMGGKTYKRNLRLYLMTSFFVKKIRKTSLLVKNSSILNAEHHKGEKDVNCRRYYKQNIYLSK